MSILILTLLAGAIRTIGTGISINATNIRNKRKAIEEGKDTYMDHNFVLHHVENDQPFMYVTDWRTREIWEINPYNQAKIRNVTKDNKRRIMEENRLKAIKEGRDFYPCEHMTKNHSRDYYGDGIVGYRYKRVDNNSTYVKRRIAVDPYSIQKIIFYMNIDTKKYEYYDLGKHPACTVEEAEKLMNELNEEQERMMKTGLNRFGAKLYPGEINQNLRALRCEAYDNGD